MRPSPQRHPLAVLRTITGLTQKELAQILDCSVPTIQAVELGKLKLSMELAMRVSFQTRISTEWLLAGDVSRPPVTNDDKPYTKALFEQRQAAILSPKESGIEALADFWQTRGMFMRNVRLLAILYTEAYKRGKAPIAFYKATIATKEIFEKDLGGGKELAEKLRPLTYSAEIGPIDLFELTETLDQFEGDTNEELRHKLKQAKKPLPDFLKTLVPGHGKRPARGEKKKWISLQKQVGYTPSGKAVKRV